MRSGFAALPSPIRDGAAAALALRCRRRSHRTGGGARPCCHSVAAVLPWSTSQAPSDAMKPSVSLHEAVRLQASQALVPALHEGTKPSASLSRWPVAARRLLLGCLAPPTAGCPRPWLPASLPSECLIILKFEFILNEIISNCIFIMQMNEF